MSSERLLSRTCDRLAGVLLIEEPGGASAGSRAVAERLEQAGRPVIETGRAAGSWEETCAIAEDALLELRQTCETVIVGGFSTGAIPSLLLAARHPDKVHATILFAPKLCLTQRPWHARLLSGAGELSGATVEQRRLAHQLTRELSRIAQPALVVHSRSQERTGFDDAWHLQRNLRGMVEMVVVDGSHSNIALERAAGFIERISAKRTKAKAGGWRPSGRIGGTAEIGAQASAA